MGAIIESLFSWMGDILTFVNSNWLVRDFVLVGFIGLCLDLIFYHRKDD